MFKDLKHIVYGVVLQKLGDSTSSRSCVIRSSCYITRLLYEFSIINNVFFLVLLCVFLSAFVVRLVNLFLTCTYIAYSFGIRHFVSLTIFIRNQELIVLKQVFVKVCNV